MQTQLKRVMATISTSTFLDDGTARTAGEAMTINSGAVLTVRTDTRWHANAPASMTGTLAAINTSSNGGFMVEGRNVRWAAYNTGSGNVPAIGTTITQGGVSGYLLGVWSSLTSAPTAVGAAMPATGFIKFREVTGGPYSAGALTGIGASLTGADTPGWIEVAIEATAILGYSGLGLQMRGSWFELGTTTGSAGQVIQVPTNGGGSGTTVTGVQIETSPGSGVYEWYPSLVANSTTGGFITAALTTDSRAKFVQYIGNGQVRIGSDGTNNIGFVPASGCKIRCPNIFIRQASSGSRASNTLPSTTLSSRSTLVGSNSATVDIENADINLYINSSGQNVLRLINTAVDSRINVSSIRSLLEINNCCIGYSVVAATQGLVVTALITPPGSSISNSKFPTILSGNAGIGIALSATYNLPLTNVESIYVFNRAGTQSSVSITGGCGDISIDGLKSWGGQITIANTTNILVKDVDYIDRLSGATTTANAHSVFSMSNANVSNIKIDGITFGNYGALENCQPYGSLVISAGNTGVRIQNVGSRANPLSVGSNATFFTNRIYDNSGNDTDIEIKRVYLTNSRAQSIALAASTINALIESVYSANTSTIAFTGTNYLFKGLYGVVPNIAAQKFSSFFIDNFTSDTVGAINLYPGAPAGSSPFLEYNFTGQTVFNDSGQIIFTNGNNSYAIYEMPYFALGHTGFANSDATLTGTGLLSSLTIEYQINTGSGWNGTWKAATGANLSGETVPATGVKLKIRITCGSDTASTLTRIAIATTSTAAAQADNLYPLDVSTLSFTGLQVGSEVRAYLGTDPATSVELAGVESTAGSTFSFTHDKGGQDGYLMVFALGYQPIRIPYTYKSTDDTILIQQVVDRNYSNPT